ncbi:MAG: hypothetical protein JXJ20_03750 [Anaerolineae bacterium]|nr:hypothetical protein [Anaerolineae bacterium]
MNSHRCTRLLRHSGWLLAGILLVLLSGCGAIDDVIGDRKPPTPTRPPLSTATPGGKLSVWLVTPTGQFAEDITPTPPGTPAGNPVGPAATATAAMATIQAATATAAAPEVAPYYQPDECPDPGSPAPPTRPQSFDNYNVMIGRYLSAGGSPTVLEATLRNWGAVTDQGGVVQADTDLTGDGVLEIIVTLFNPMVYNPDALLNAGQLLVYGCDNGGYRLLYATDYNDGIALPELARVGDMNTDVRNELVFFTQTCNVSSCYKEAKILTWNAIVGVFEELNSGQIIAINGRVGVADIDGDGVLELTAQINPPGTSDAGPPRSVLDTWDWTGIDYVLALREEEEPRYRIHAVYDADDLFREGEWRPALNAYAELRTDNQLLAWTVPGEYEILRAYAAFRIMIIYALMGNGRAEDWFNMLQSENPPGTPGEGFAQMGVAFMDNYRATGDTRAACAQAINTGMASPAVLSGMNGYGYANRTYSLGDICPF